MASGRLILPVAEPVLNNDGVPQVGALLTVYENNTTTLASIFAEASLSTPLANPQTADEAGLFYDQSTEMWADASVPYSAKLELPDGTIYTFDDVYLVGETLQAIPYATDAEAIAGTATDLVINPANLAAVLATLPVANSVPTGTVIEQAGVTPPVGYLPCDGSDVSRATYTALWTFAQSSGMMAADATDHTNNPGKWYVGNGSTTFTLPNFGGVFTRGWTATQTIDPARAVGTTQASDNKAHTHSLGASVPIAGSGFGYSGSSGVTGATVSTTASSGGSESRPINVALPRFVKT